MKKSIIAAIAFTFIPLLIFAQEDLQKIYSQVKNPFIRWEEINGLVPSLKRIQPASLDSAQQQQLFETYRLAADRYAANNHYKQAYLLYDDYLVMKEKALAAEKAHVINATNTRNAEMQQQTIAGIKGLKSELDVLAKDEERLKARSNNFIRNVSLVIILLTVIFVLVFLRISWKLKKVKDDLHENRTLLLAMEKTALLGRLREQIEKASDKQMETISSEITSIHSLFRQTETGLTREQLPVFKKIKETFSKAGDDMKNLHHLEN